MEKAFVSAFIDNIPYTTAMVPVIVALAENPELGLELTPLTWALSFGTCFGGNGTIIGASANVVACGLFFNSLLVLVLLLLFLLLLLLLKI